MGKGFFHIKDFLSADSNKQGKREVDPVPAGQVTHAWATGMEENKTAYEHKKLFVGQYVFISVLSPRVAKSRCQSRA